MQVSKIIRVGLWLCVWFATNAAALTFEYTDGTKFSGDIVQKQPGYLQVRIESGYTNLDWSKLTQETLKELKDFAVTSKDQKLEDYVAPYIEISAEDKIKKTEVTIKTNYEKLERPAKGSLLGAMFKSSVGLVCLLLLYAANIYAGYEIACVRAYPPAMVCGIAAVAPVVGPVIFLCLPTKLPSREDEIEESPSAAPAGTAGHSAAHGEGATSPEALSSQEAVADQSGHAATAAVPQTQVFKRGQFTFNRRFIETKFSPFFGAIRRGEHKDMVLLVKTARGEFIATRISRIAANDMHLDVHKGGASHEVQVPFVEIHEIHIKPQNA